MMTAPARQDKKPPVVMGMPSDVDSQPVSAKSNELVTSANRPKVRRYRGEGQRLDDGLNDRVHQREHESDDGEGNHGF